RLGIDRHELIASTKDVVVVKVTVHQPLRHRIELGEQLASERSELAPLSIRIVEPPLYLSRYRPERRSRTTPQPRRKVHGDRGPSLVRPSRQVISRHRALRLHCAP